MSTNEREFTADLAMFYACGNGGLAGEFQRLWPQSYLDTHVVADHGRVDMSPDKARAVALLLGKGWVERREITRSVPADDFMGAAIPAHTLISVTYHATDNGRAEWSQVTP